LSRYAEAVSIGLSELTCQPDDYPTLFLETGRALIDDAGYLLTSVIANKRLPDGQRSVVIDAGVNILFTAFWYKHEIVPAQAVSGTPEQAIIHGPLCMNIDVIRPSLLFPPVEVGDKLVIKSVGAYNVTQWMQFITYRPAVVMISTSGDDAIIRRAEDLSTITDMEEVPGWLQD
jgi:diaminopimelate decarboxylase